MKRLLLYLLLGTTSLYLAIRWLPSEDPISFSFYFSQLIFNPIKFFAASIAFLFAFLFFSSVFQAFLTQVYNLIKRRKAFSLMKFIVSLFIAYVPILLHDFSFWTLTINLIIAFLYGIFTLDLKQDEKLETDN
jgi:hypothetical protein